MTNPTIRMGSTNTAAVQLAQGLLVTLGYLPPSTAPGLFGPIMDGAVKAFQKAHNILPIDGVIGANTWAGLTYYAALKAGSNGSYTAGPPVLPAKTSTKNAAPGDMVGPAFEFEPMEITGRMPSVLDKMKRQWAGLSTGQKVGVVAGVALIGAWFLNGRK